MSFLEYANTDSARTLESEEFTEFMNRYFGQQNPKLTFFNGQYLPADSPAIPEPLKTGPSYEKPLYVFPDAKAQLEQRQPTI